MTDTAARAAIGAATRELRLPIVRTDAKRPAEIAERSQLSYLAFLAEVVSAEVDQRVITRNGRRPTSSISAHHASPRRGSLTCHGELGGFRKGEDDGGDRES